MIPLSSKDFTRLQEAILALYSHRDTASFRGAVPGIFLGIIRAGYFSMVDSRADFEKRTVKVLDVWESRPQCVGPFLATMERTLWDHPFTQHGLKNGTSGAMMLSDFQTLPQLRRTRLYKEVLEPAGGGRMLSVGSFGGPGIATLTVARPDSEPDFTERDRTIMELLRPHFDQARANLERETMTRASRTHSLKSSGLTPRETEVALWLAQGKSNPEIAIILGAPVRTVEKHLERILHKMGVGNRVSAAVAVAEIIGG